MKNLIISTFASASILLSSTFSKENTKDIIDTAVGNGNFKTLAAALTAAGLIDTLKGDGPFTVFAPNDEGFAKLPKGTVESLLKPENKAKLINILTYHVVSGKVPAKVAVTLDKATAINKQDIKVKKKKAGLFLNKSKVIATDINASNGVIHVIDKVLMPPADLATCDYTVGIGLSGMAFNPSVVEINVGETVCWQWTDETMAHNVKEVNGDKSSVYVEGGISSGAADTTVDFRYTFTEDSTTFYYVCEPHVMAEMYGKVIVGDGGVTVSEDTTPTTVSYTHLRAHET